MADKILAPFALLLFIAFIGFLIAYVPEIDLIIVLVGVAAMACYDFWITVTGNGDQPTNGDRSAG